MGTIPKVQVYEKEHERPNRFLDGSAGRIAIIGPFERFTASVVSATTLKKAYEILGQNLQYEGTRCLPHIFRGANSILVSSTTKGTKEKPDMNFNLERLNEALKQLKTEDFDILFVAAQLEDEHITAIDEFCKERFKNKLPCGYMGCVDRRGLDKYQATAKIAGRHTYGLITQQVILSSGQLSLVETAAYYTGLVAGLKVNTSMTYKQLPDAAVYGYLPFGEGELGEELVKLGYTIFNCVDRVNKVHVVVNSELFCGYDLYIVRTIDYIIKMMNLHQFLGMRNRSATLSEIKQEVTRVAQLCVDTYDLCKDIKYEIMKKNTNCVDVVLSEIVFEGIITEIDVYISIEVE